MLTRFSNHCQLSGHRWFFAGLILVKTTGWVNLYWHSDSQAVTAIALSLFESVLKSLFYDTSAISGNFISISHPLSRGKKKYLSTRDRAWKKYSGWRNLFNFGFFEVAMLAQYRVVFSQDQLLGNISRVFLGDIVIPGTFCADQTDFLYSWFCHYTSSKECGAVRQLDIDLKPRNLRSELIHLRLVVKPRVAMKALLVRN